MKMFMKTRGPGSRRSARPEMSCAGVGERRESDLPAIVIGPIANQWRGNLRWRGPCHAVICRKLMALHLNSRMYGINVIGFFFPPFLRQRSHLPVFTFVPRFLVFPTSHSQAGGHLRIMYFLGLVHSLILRNTKYLPNVNLPFSYDTVQLYVGRIIPLFSLTVQSF